MRPKAFWFHYNKPASAQAREPRMSVHWSGACHIVKDVVVEVPTRSRRRTRQPRVVMAGKAVTMDIVDGVAYLRP